MVVVLIVVVVMITVVVVAAGPVIVPTVFSSKPGTSRRLFPDVRLLSFKGRLLRASDSIEQHTTPPLSDYPHRIFTRTYTPTFAGDGGAQIIPWYSRLLPLEGRPLGASDFIEQHRNSPLGMSIH